MRALPSFKTGWCVIVPLTGCCTLAELLLLLFAFVVIVIGLAWFHHVFQVAYVLFVSTNPNLRTGWFFVISLAVLVIFASGIWSNFTLIYYSLVATLALEMGAHTWHVAWRLQEIVLAFWSCEAFFFVETFAALDDGILLIKSCKMRTMSRRAIRLLTEHLKMLKFIYSSAIRNHSHTAHLKIRNIIQVTMPRHNSIIKRFAPFFLRCTISATVFLIDLYFVLNRIDSF